MLKHRVCQLIYFFSISLTLTYHCMAMSPRKKPTPPLTFTVVTRVFDDEAPPGDFIGIGQATACMHSGRPNDRESLENSLLDQSLTHLDLSHMSDPLVTITNSHVTEITCANHTLERLVLNTPNIKTLNVAGCANLVTIDIAHDSTLKKLIIDNCVKLDRTSLLRLMRRSPHLSHISFVGMPTLKLRTLASYFHHHPDRTCTFILPQDVSNDFLIEAEMLAKAYKVGSYNLDRVDPSEETTIAREQLAKVRAKSLQAHAMTPRKYHPDASVPLASVYETLQDSPSLLAVSVTHRDHNDLLSVSHENVVDLDVSHNPALPILIIHAQNIEFIDASHNPNLRSLTINLLDLMGKYDPKTGFDVPRELDIDITACPQLTTITFTNTMHADLAAIRLYVSDVEAQRRITITTLIDDTNEDRECPLPWRFVDTSTGVEPMQERRTSRVTTFQLPIACAAAAAGGTHLPDTALIRTRRSSE